MRASTGTSLPFFSVLLCVLRALCVTPLWGAAKDRQRRPRRRAAPPPVQRLAVLSHHPSIAIIGAGAVGGYYGARLAHHGHDVHFMLRSDYQRVKRDGWNIKSVAGDFHIAPDQCRVYDDPLKMPRCDLVIVTLKTTSNDQFDSLIRPVLKDDTQVLTLQNGLGNEERLAELFGGHRVLGGLAFVCINRVSPGVIHHIDHGTIYVGEFGGGPGSRARHIAHLFASSGIPCEVLDDLRVGRWGKLVWNVPFSGLGAVLNLTTDRLIASPAGVQLVSAIMQEVIDAARGLGLKLPPDMVERQLRNTRTMGAYRSSMQIDREAGRPLEVEAILGEPLRQAAAAGVPTPHIQMLYRLVKLIDPSPASALHHNAGGR